MGKSKTVTTINISKKVLADIRASGIKNMSKYFEDLAKAELYNVNKLSKNEKDQLAKLSQELEYWSKEWEEYLVKQKVNA